MTNVWGTKTVYTLFVVYTKCPKPLLLWNKINSKHRRVESFEACCQWVLHNVQIITLLSAFTVQKYIYPSVILRMRILKFWQCRWMDLYLREGEQMRVTGENHRKPARKLVPHIGRRKFTPQPGIKPSPSNIGDNMFAWSECAGSNPLNYRLPPVFWMACSFKNYMQSFTYLISNSNTA